MEKRGSIKIFRRIILSHSAEFFLVESFTVALVSSIDKVWIRRGEYQDLPSKTFCLTVPKNYVRESFIVALILGTEKTWRRGSGGDYQDFSSTIFCHTVPKIYLRESFSVALNSGSEKVWIRVGGGEGVSRFSIENFLSHSAERLRRGTLFCYIFFGYLKGLDKRGGGDSNTPSKFFSHSPENFRRGFL